MEKKEEKKFPSELRLDLASENWVIIATGRAKRPELFKKEKKPSEKVSKKGCPFCEIAKQTQPTLIFSKGKEVKEDELPKDWTLAVIPNKFPAFLPGESLDKKLEGGIYQVINAVGYHEVVVMRDHNKHLALLSEAGLKEVIDAYQSRYQSLMKKPFVSHIAVFHNHGSEAGASIYHPHSQIITTPLIDPDLKQALSVSKDYFKKNKECVYCRMARFEMKAKKRVVFENKDFLVICPFASKMAFQVIISPKRHLSYFEKATNKEKAHLAEALKQALSRINKGLNNPPYNYYLHNSPCDGKDYSYYHWHWTVLPKTSIQAGFELGAGMEISTIEPEKAAEYLRNQKI